MELKEYIENLKDDEKDIISMRFNDKNYEKSNHRFQQCYKIAENLTRITTPKMFVAVIEFQLLPAEYADSILDIARNLKPINKKYYNKLKEYLIETYILRMKKLVKAGKANILLCENEKHINRFINLKTRVIDYCEILDIIYGLEFNVEEFKKGYKGNGKLKNAINDVYQFLLSRKSKKLDKIKERTFDQITDRIYNNLEDLDARVGLK